MTFHTVPLSSLGEYGYAPVSFSPRPYTPADNASISPPTLTYSLSNADASSDDQHSGRHSRGSNPSPPPSVPYAATVPRSHRFNPIGVPPPTRTSARTAATKRRNSKTTNEDSDDPEEEEYQQSTGSVDPWVLFFSTWNSTAELHLLVVERLFVGNASSPNKSVVMSWETVTLVWNLLCRRSTKNRAKWRYWIAVGVNLICYRSASADDLFVS